MYAYNVGYYSHEESAYWQFFHENKFSEEELLGLTEECLFECLKINRHSTLQGLYHNGFVAEMEKRGFKSLEFECEIGLFGWTSATNTKDWPNEDDMTEGVVVRLKERLDAHSMHK